MFAALRTTRATYPEGMLDKRGRSTQTGHPTIGLGERGFRGLRCIRLFPRMGLLGHSGHFGVTRLCPGPNTSGCDRLHMGFREDTPSRQFVNNQSLGLQ
jgi:hypothetical protein